MYKVLRIAFFCTLFSWTLFGQCPEGDVAFSTQAEIEQFITNFPNCTEINGNLYIGGTPNYLTDLSNLSGISIVKGDLDLFNLDGLTSLDGLDGLTSIEGSFQILGCDNLLNLQGLNNLITIDGELKLLNNSSLVSLSGLNNLNTIGLDLQIRIHEALTSLDDLSDLSFVGGGIEISSNSSLLSISGLNSLISTEGFLYIARNDVLESLEGLDNMTSIGGTLIISDCDNVTTLEPLSNLEFISGGLRIEENDGLASLEGLENLLSLDGNLEISFNSGLTSLTGIENIDASTINFLSINVNEELSECEIESICSYLTIGGQIALIAANNDGCRNRSEVEMACAATDLDNFSDSEKKITLFPNPSQGILHLPDLDIQSVLVYNLQGQLVDFFSTPGNELNLSTLSAGMYNLEILTNRRQYFAKIVRID